MKSIFKIPAIFILSYCLFAIGCKKNSFNADGWSPTLLGPIATGNVTAEVVGDIRNKHFEQQIAPYDLGYSPGVTIPFLPGLFIKELGPYTNQISPYFQYAQIDSADFKVSFVNNFPVSIRPGTRLVLRSTQDDSNPSNIIVSHAVTSSITPNSTYSFPLSLTNKIVPSTIYLFLNDFQTDSASNVVFSNQSTLLTFDLNILKVKLIAINTNKSYTLSDTTGFQITSGQTGTVSDSSIAGSFKIFLANKLPVNLSTQLIFLDGNKNVIDSLIQGNSLAPAAITDVNGNATSFVESKFLIPVNYNKLRHLAQCQYIVYRIKADTDGLPGSAVYGGPTSGADFQIVTDMKVKMGTFFN